MGFLIMPKPFVGLKLKAVIIQFAGREGTSKSNMNRPCGPILISRHIHTLS